MYPVSHLRSRNHTQGLGDEYLRLLLTVLRFYWALDPS